MLSGEGVELSTRQKLAWDVTAFTPKCPCMFEKEIRGNVVEFLEKWNKLEMAATSLHDDALLIPKNVTSERPTALLPTVIRWWEAVRASEVMEWQQRCRIEWDAIDGRNGGAQRTVLEILMETEGFKFQTR